MESWLKSESTSEDDRHASSSRLQSASCLHSCLELARPARLASAGDSLEASMGKFCCVMGFGLSTKKEEVEEKEEEEEEEGEEDGKTTAAGASSRSLDVRVARDKDRETNDLVC
uniref:Uncharacterized protein n=1 Tax=Vespula pensylvanica TaxID=30213 RepID=A0A834U5E0_VESPE|nr:hypothetical protein H0235_011638 [Vespula pensylvanica]